MPDCVKRTRRLDLCSHRSGATSTVQASRAQATNNIRIAHAGLARRKDHESAVIMTQDAGHPDRLLTRDERERERLAELERRSLLAEQARQLAHGMRTPLSVIELVCEALQLELQDDRARVERLDSVLCAAARLSAMLTEAVSSARFADGPPRLLDAAGIAAHVVRLLGGAVEWATDRGRASTQVLAQPDALEAGILHALRLAGFDGDHGAQQRPVLRCQVADELLTLRIAAPDSCRPRPTEERADRQLMIQAAERVARDGGGAFTLARDGVAFQFPLAISAQG
jgi:signal transduction histidine kinase